MEGPWAGAMGGRWPGAMEGPWPGAMEGPWAGAMGGRWPGAMGSGADPVYGCILLFAVGMYCTVWLVTGCTL